VASPVRASQISEDKAVRLLANLMEQSRDKGIRIRREVQQRIANGEGCVIKDAFFPVAVLRRALEQANARDTQAQQLIQMGITGDLEAAIRALHDSQGDLNLAATMLLSASEGG